MKKIASFVVTTIVSSFLASSAIAQTTAAAPATAPAHLQEQTCPLTTLKPADGGFKRIGIRAPKATATVNGAPVRVNVMHVQIAMPLASARTDSNLDNPKMLRAYDCGDTSGFVAAAENLPDYDATEIVVPENLSKGTKIRVCTKSVGCATGEFEEFGKWVTLTVKPASATTGIAPKVSGTYKD